MKSSFLYNSVNYLGLLAKIKRIYYYLCCFMYQLTMKIIVVSSKCVLILCLCTAYTKLNRKKGNRKLNMKLLNISKMKCCARVYLRNVNIDFQTKHSLRQCIAQFRIILEHRHQNYCCSFVVWIAKSEEKTHSSHTLACLHKN